MSSLTCGTRGTPHWGTECQCPALPVVPGAPHTGAQNVNVQPYLWYPTLGHRMSMCSLTCGTPHWDTECQSSPALPVVPHTGAQNVNVQPYLWYPGHPPLGHRMSTSSFSCGPPHWGTECQSSPALSKVPPTGAQNVKVQPYLRYPTLAHRMSTSSFSFGTPYWGTECQRPALPVVPVVTPTGTQNVNV